MKILEIWHSPMKTDPRAWVWAIVWREDARNETLAGDRAVTAVSAFLAAMKHWEDA